MQASVGLALEADRFVHCKYVGLVVAHEQAACAGAERSLPWGEESLSLFKC